MAVGLAKVPLVVLSFASVSVFLVGDIKHEGRKKRASHVSEGDGRGGYGVCEKATCPRLVNPTQRVVSSV